MKKNIQSFLDSPLFTESSILLNKEAISGGYYYVTTAGGTKATRACASGCVTYTSDSVKYDDWNCPTGSVEYMNIVDCPDKFTSGQTLQFSVAASFGNFSNFSTR
jgi:hypothetical protein